MCESVFATFSGDSSSLTAHFLPELQLDSHSSYLCALVQCTYDVAPNIHDKENNALYFTHKQTVGTKPFSIKVPTGYYTFSDLAKHIETASTNLGHRITLRQDISSKKITIITGDDKICIEVKHDHTDGIAPLLGFSDKFYCHAKEYTSQNPAKLWNEQPTKVYLECDLIGGAYHNGNITHTIHEFDITANDYEWAGKLDYKIVEAPKHLVYLPINRHRISSINITAFDQTREQLKLNGGRLHCRIHIKKDAYISKHT